MKIPSEITFETTETNWVCMIVFLCAHVRISISTYRLYWQALLFTYPYRLTSSDATRRCVFVYVGKLVGWKTSTFFIQRLQTFFFNFCHVFYVFNVFLIFFSGTFFFTSMVFSSSSSSRRGDRNVILEGRHHRSSFLVSLYAF